jgi:periplasmic divalent cation tolerance protein
MEIVAILTTIDSAERAQAIAGALVERKLAACVQISEVESVYSWKGTVQREREFRIMAKTLAGRYADAEAAIRELHTYELPAIYAVPVTEVFAPYADWIAENIAQ